MSNNIIVELKRIRELGDLEKSIGNYILYNLELTTDIDIRTLAINTYSSPSAISRFVKRLGYRGFKEFKYELGKYNEKQRLSTGSFSSSKVEITLNKVHQILDLNADILNKNEFEAFVDCLIKNKKVYIFANGGSYESAYDLTIKLQRYGIVAILTNDNIIQKQLASIPEDVENTVFVIISSSGETSHLVEIAKKVVETKKTLLSITGNTNNTISRLSKINLRFENEDDVINSLVGSNRIILNVIIEIILNIVIEKKGIDLKRIIKTVS